MGTIQDIQHIKYRTIVDLIKNEEPYDKKQRVISGLEAFYLCHKRYESLQDILMPLESILGENVTIVSVNFNNTMQDEISVTIKYLVDDKLNMMVINTFDLEILDVVLSNRLIDSDSFLEANRDILSLMIRELEEFEYFDETEMSIKSVSKRFIASDNCNDFIIKSSEEKLFSIGTNHYSYDKDKKLYVPDHITSDSDKVKEILMDEEVIQKIYSNLRIYEDDFPKKLIKKIM